jgi:membrane protease YdiL (CAAX protease family)
MRAAAHKYAILEPVAIFVAIMAYIWGLRFTHPGMSLAILATMVASNRIHREGAGRLGFSRDHLEECCEKFAPAVVVLGLALLGGGIVTQSLRAMRADQAVLAWAAYLPWGLLQQYVLNGYFLNRLEASVSHRPAAAISAALFSGAHTPNWFLMAVTLVAGYVCARVYRRYPNLYFLGAAHATLGFLLLLVVPDSISHHLAVGPGWFVR